MKVAISIQHPAQVHLCRVFNDLMKKRGHAVQIFHVKKEISSLKKKYSSTNNLENENSSLKSSLLEKESTITSLNTQITQINKIVKELKSFKELKIQDLKELKELK